MHEPDTCDEIRELLPELAAGVADGDARALALVHLARCLDCRRELNEITTVLDELILLAPEHEPSPGFESSVLNALTPAGTRRRPLRGTALAAAAVMIVAALTGGLVWRQTSDDRQVARQYRNTLAVADGRYFTATSVSAAGESSVGHAFAYQGAPSWVFISLVAAPSSGTFEVRLITTDDQTIDIGRCQVRNGKGSWGSDIQVPIRDIERIHLVRPGVPTMTARFG